MHAYLITGVDNNLVQAKIEELTRQIKVKALTFPLTKIEDTRSLNTFLRLKVKEPIAVVINSIEEATPEAANAFLKNLEEPQEGLYFILTAESVHKVLPTIVSRSQIIKVKGKRANSKNEEIDKFLDMSVGKKLAFADKIRDRGEAKTFVRDLIESLHQKLHESNGGYSVVADNLGVTQKTLANLEANGNVALQLANMVINLKIV